MKKPRLSILDKRFVYRDSASTSVALTFARIRREMKAEAAKPKAAPIAIKRKVA